MISFLIEILTLLWGPAKDASVPNVVKDPEQLASANTLGLVAAYGTFLLGAVFFAVLAGVSKWLGDIHYLGRFHQQSDPADLGRRVHVPRLGAAHLAAATRRE